MKLKDYKRRGWRSTLKNLYLQWRALQYSKRNTDFKYNKDRVPSSYRYVWGDSFSGELDPKRWRLAHPWGRVHPRQAWKWWPAKGDPIQLVRHEPEGLALDLTLYPRKFKSEDLPKWQQEKFPAEWTAPYGIGLISSKEQFKYGWFEAEVRMPAAPNLWCAFWLSGRENWPPEIDIFEAYTGGQPHPMRVEPNIHYLKDNGVKSAMGAPDIRVKNPHKRWVKYACHWTPDFVRWYYDGRLVQECKDPEILRNLNDEQYIIINNGCKDPKVTGWESEDCTMLVRNLKVYQ